MESDAAVGQREESVVTTHADIGTRVNLRPALTDNNIAANNFLAAKFFHAKTATD